MYISSPESQRLSFGVIAVVATDIGGVGVLEFGDEGYKAEASS